MCLSLDSCQRHKKTESIREPPDKHPLACSERAVTIVPTKFCGSLLRHFAFIHLVSEDIRPLPQNTVAESALP